MSNGIAYPDVLSNVDMPGPGRSAPMAATGSRLNITVCDPVKQDQGINAYITYKVCSYFFVFVVCCSSLLFVRRTPAGLVTPGLSVPLHSAMGSS